MSIQELVELPMLRGVTGLMLVTLVLINLGALLAHRRLIFKPPVRRRDVSLGPYAGSYRVEPVHIEVEPGVVLQGWWSVPLTQPVRCTLLYFGGRGENTVWSPHMSSHVSGLSVLSCNYRGFGASDGVASAATAVRDARAIRAWLDAHLASDDRAGSPRVVMGRSLGTVVAMRLASETAPSALVLISPFDSLAAMVRRRLPVLWPATWLLDPHLQVQGLARHIECPTLAILGVGDRQVPRVHSMKLLGALAGPVRLHELVDHPHRDLPRSPVTQQLLAQFLMTLGDPA
jgi:pimeloyl-ACP methyl ester carboxylesterase